MSIQDLGALGEFIGSVLVLGSLLYLILQLRHTQKTVMSQMHQMRADGLLSSWQNFAGNKGVREAYIALQNAGWTPGQNYESAKEALSHLTLEQRYIIGYWENGLYVYGENSFYQYKQGFYDDEFYEHNLRLFVRRQSGLWLALRFEQSGRPEWIDLVKSENEKAGA